ncbi:TolC family protein [Variovorax sp. HJSM1_2]|uniref:TolC family protein n=1 Tax=Variovorax sp. HJSM1_2 TaxID=3366263 RepID=UPI003BD3A7E0
MKRITVVAVAALTLAGCASFSPDGGSARVAEMTRERVGQKPVYQRTENQIDNARTRVSELVRQPLTSDSAVELAFLNNRGLQASFSELGIAEAELVRAGRLRNPTFSFGRLREAGGIVEIDRAVMFDILGLLTLPIASDIEQRRFAQVQLQVAHEAVGLAAETRKAFFSAVAAQELVTYYLQVKEAADASNELARRMVRAGNFNKLAQMREQAFYADATSQLARAQYLAVVARERLSRLLGLSGTQTFMLPDRLPELPQQPIEPKDAEQTALLTRLDVQMAKRATEHTAKSLGLTKTTSLINVLEVGYQNKSVSGEPRANGYEIELALPLFDFGATRVARAEATYMQAVHRTAQVAIDARSEVRESYAAYRTSFDLARHYRDEVVPLRKRISEENLLRYNGMLIGVFELLADSRDQVTSVTGYLEALRDFWVAQTNLQTALTGRSPGTGSAMSSSSSAGSSASSGGH